MLRELPPLLYRAHLRDKRTTFQYVVSRLDATTVNMLYSIDGRPQFPVSVQLTWSLYRLGNIGNSARTRLAAQKFGASQAMLVAVIRQEVRDLLRWEE